MSSHPLSEIARGVPAGMSAFAKCMRVRKGQ